MKSVTDIQHARAIIDKVGDPHQAHVIDMLRSLTWEHASTENERLAQKVIDNMEHEYALNVANVLWANKQETIPDWLKTYGECREGEDDTEDIGPKGKTITELTNDIIFLRDEVDELTAKQCNPNSCSLVGKLQLKSDQWKTRAETAERMLNRANMG